MSDSETSNLDTDTGLDLDSTPRDSDTNSSGSESESEDLQSGNSENESDEPSVSKEEDNCLRYFLGIGIAEKAVRMWFDTVIPPDQLENHLKRHEKKLRKKCTDEQLSNLFPGNRVVTSTTFEIALIYKLIRNSTYVRKPRKDWGETPDPTDIEPADDLERVRICRNSLLHGPQSISDNEFVKKWKELKEIIARLARGQLDGEIDSLKNKDLDHSARPSIKRRLADLTERVQHVEKCVEDHIQKNIRENIQQNWTKDNFLGQGAFGKVYACKDQKTAVKVIKINGNSTFIQKRISEIENEINLLKKLEHQRIVKYLACQHDPEEISIFMEYVPKGSLKREIDEGKRLTESTTRDYTRQILKGLDFLHKQNVVHRDIKASNILRGEDGLKLADFGVSKIMEDVSSGKLQSHVGTPHWQSPEIITNEGHGRRTDIWSLGCTIIEMLTGNPPWHEYTIYQAIYRIGLKGYPEYSLTEGTSESCKRFLSLCFTQNRKERPHAWDMLANEWITSS